MVAPNFNVPSFSHLTLSSMVDHLRKEINNIDKNRPIYLIGSSLGAAVALIFLREYDGVKHNIKKLILISPSFDFVQNRILEFGFEGIEKWKQQGWLEFYHNSYHKKVKLHYNIIEDIKQYNLFDYKPTIPSIIIHGIMDKIVPYQQSLLFVNQQENINLILLHGGHRLLKLKDQIWSIVFQFFEIYREVNMPEIKIDSYDLTQMKDREDFLSLEGDFLSVLEKGYGSSFYSKDIHLNRIYSEKHMVFVALFKKNGNKMIGCSYVRPDGKRAALAVIPEYQNKGVGKMLVCESIKYFDNQHTEVSPDNKRMINLLNECGFYCVRSMRDFWKYQNEFRDIIYSVKISNEIINYSRRSRANFGLSHDFVLLAFKSIKNQFFEK